MLGKEDVVLKILEFISTLDFKKVEGGARIQLFEVSIRHFAGLISAWDLLNGPYSSMAKDEGLRKALYSQMVNLGDALSCAFDTPSGVPRNWVDPALCKSDDGTSNTVAGAGTLILEFSRLTDITGEPKYARLARRAESHLLNPHPSEYEIWPGIIGSFLSVANGDMINVKGSWGSLADCEHNNKSTIATRTVANSLHSVLRVSAQSLCVQLRRVPILSRALASSRRLYDQVCLNLQRIDSAVQNLTQRRYIGSHPYGHPEWALLPYWEGEETFNYMDSLSWFVGGNMILGGMVTSNQTLIDFGLSIANAAGEIYHSTLTGLGGEFVGWTTDCSGDWSPDCNAENSMRITSGEFKLRPEVMETWYYAYRATKDPKYREWIWQAFDAINTHCKTETGFSAIKDVNLSGGGEKLDQQESFIFAEVFKYAWLVHLDDERNSLHVHDGRKGLKNSWVYNTEAHPFKVAGTPV